MPYDAFTVSALTSELNSLLTGGKINKVLQPKKDEIILVIYNQKNTYRLLLCAAAVNPRINISKGVKENPETPYSFCMALRKHLSGGTIAAVEQLPYDRVVTVVIENLSEMFDTVKFGLVIEIMGRQSNIILTDSSRKILALQKSLPLDTAKRAMLCGMTYSYPVNDKIALSNQEAVASLFDSFAGDIDQTFLCENIAGLSKQTAKHIVCRANQLADGAFNKEAVKKALAEFYNIIKKGDIKPCIFFNGGDAVDFYILPYCYSQGEPEFFNSVNECVDNFYLLKEKGKELDGKKNALLSMVAAAIKKAEKKSALLYRQLADCENAEYYRKCGEFITANIYKIKQPQTSVTVTDYYDGGEITVKLDENLSPSANAQKYYKKYNKLKTAKKQTDFYLEESQKALSYYKSIIKYIEKAQSLNELAEIEKELDGGNIIKKQTKGKAQKSLPPAVNQTEVEGFTIIWGKNNVQNDFVTFKLAKPSDLWFHIKNDHGPHVIIKTEGNTPGNNVIEAAARIAASLEQGDRAAVDYTFKKFVKKPPAAKPGFVIYTDFKTILIKQ